MSFFKVGVKSPSMRADCLRGSCAPGFRGFGVETKANRSVQSGLRLPPELGRKRVHRLVADFWVTFGPVKLMWSFTSKTWYGNLPNKWYQHEIEKAYPSGRASKCEIRCHAYRLRSGWAKNFCLPFFATPPKAIWRGVPELHARARLNGAESEIKNLHTEVPPKCLTLSTSQICTNISFPWVSVNGVFWSKTKGSGGTFVFSDSAFSTPSFVFVVVLFVASEVAVFTLAVSSTLSGPMLPATPITEAAPTEPVAARFRYGAGVEPAWARLGPITFKAIFWLPVGRFDDPEVPRWCRRWLNIRRK